MDKAEIQCTTPQVNMYHSLENTVDTSISFTPKTHQSTHSKLYSKTPQVGLFTRSHAEDAGNSQSCIFHRMQEIRNNSLHE